MRPASRCAGRTVGSAGAPKIPQHFANKMLRRCARVRFARQVGQLKESGASLTLTWRISRSSIVNVAINSAYFQNIINVRDYTAAFYKDIYMRTILDNYKLVVRDQF